MCTLQERYDVERNRAVKNIPLLKTLREQIQQSCAVAAETAEIRLQLQAAEFSEDWDQYAELEAKLTRIVGDTDVTAIEVVMPTTVTVSDDIVRTTDTVSNDDDEDGILGTTDTVSNHDAEDELDLRRGAMYRSPNILLKQVSDYANSRHFTVRREKHAIVCSNAGLSNWTSVTNYEARAEQAYRKIHKQKDQDIALNIDDLLETEEDKVSPTYWLSLHLLPIFFHFFYICNSRSLRSLEPRHLHAAIVSGAYD